MENNKTRLNKVFRFNSNVYIMISNIYGNYSVIKGRIVGVREFSTAYSKLIYTIDTAEGRFEVLPGNVYESVQEFIDEVEQHVVE